MHARENILNQQSKSDTMAEMCECFGNCELFKSTVANLPSTAKAFQDKFCKIDNTACARYIVYQKLGRELVPADLYPNERGKAMTMIAAA